MEDTLWVSGRDEEGPYVKRGDQWIGYEDPISVKIKTAYVRATGLGGVSLWSLDLEDFQVTDNSFRCMLEFSCCRLQVEPCRVFAGILGRC